MIYREERKTGSFIQIHKEIIDNPNITANAKGVLIYLLSKPDDWDFYETEIKSHFKDGLKTIKSAIQELIEEGYVIRNRTRTKDGRFIYDYIIYERKQK